VNTYIRLSKRGVEKAIQEAHPYYHYHENEKKV